MPERGALLADRYRLADRIGSGGMGEVWRATDTVLDRTVAVKLVRRELVAEPNFADRFLAEARTMATLRHRGVVAVHDYRSDDDGAFLVMEYVEGEALADRLRRSGRLDPALAMSLVAQAAEALQAAHDKGVVHRDIKPGNLLVTGDDTLVLTDFGIARSAAATSPLTATGAVLGTPAYLSPEQVLGKPATARSDVYALGIVAYECLSGRRPFEGENPFEIAARRLREAPPPLPGDLPEAVTSVVERAMALDPGHRWPSAAQFARAARQAGAAPAGGSATATAHPTYVSGRVMPPANASAAAPLPAPPAAPSPAPDPAAGAPAPAGPVVAGGPGRSRPVTVLAANLLLRLVALAILVYCTVSALLLDELLVALRSTFGVGFEQWYHYALAFGLLSLSALGLLGLLFLMLASYNARGSRAARAWTFTLGPATLCCGGAAWWLAGLDVAGNRLVPADAVELDRAFTEQLPDWYGPVTDLTTVGALAALLLALMLLTLPASQRFFRSPPARPPYHYPYPPAPHRPPRF